MAPFSPAAYGIMFHQFYDDQHYYSPGAISAQDLRKLLQHEGIKNILSPQEWIERAEHGALLPHHRCLTFDDNLRCQYDVALPVLEDYGLKAFWFVQTMPLTGELTTIEVYRYFRYVYFPDFEVFFEEFLGHLRDSRWGPLLEHEEKKFRESDYLKQFTYYTDHDRWFRYIRDELLSISEYDAVMQGMMAAYGVDLQTLNRQMYMDAECLLDLTRKDHQVGLHTHTHPLALARLDEEQQRCEYETGFRVLQDILGKPPVSMSHPCDSYNETTLKVLHELGLRIGFRAIMVKQNIGPYQYMRREHNYIMEEIES